MARKDSLFKQIFKILRDEIGRGVFANGDILPSEKELGERFNASRVTIRSSLKMLAENGIVASRAGKGWVVGKYSKPVATKTSPAPIPQDSGQILFFSNSSFFSAWLYQGVSDELLRRGFTPRLIINDEYRNDYSILLKKFGNEIAQSSGIILFSNLSYSGRAEDFADALDIPVVITGINETSVFDTVSCNYRQGSKDVVDMFAAQGCKKIVYVDNPCIHSTVPSFIERYYGYKDSMERHNLEQNLIFSDIFWSPDGKGAEDSLEVLKQADAIIVSTNEHAPNVIKYLLEQGINIPEQIGIAGFGNINDSKLPGGLNISQISYINEDWYNIGMVAANRIFSRITGDNSSATMTLVSTPFIKGDTTSFSE